MIAVASAQHQYYQPAYQTHAKEYQQVYQAPALIKKVVQPIIKHVEVEDHPKYEFAYEVHDEHTGDIKSQQETRDGDVVKGQYTLIDADGYRRVVEYTANDHDGFNAVVHREPVKGYEPKAHKVIAQPIQKYIAQPIKYEAPQYHVQPAQKVVQYEAPKYTQYVAPAPVHKVIQYEAPKYTQYVAPAPVHKVVQYEAPQYAKYVAPAPVHKVVQYEAPKYQYAAPAHKVVHGDAHTSVSFSGPSANYHY